RPITPSCATAFGQPQSAQTACCIGRPHDGDRDSASPAVVADGPRPQALQSMWTVLWTTGRSDDTRHRAQRSTWTRLTALLQLPTVLTLEPGLQSEFNFGFVLDSEWESD